MKNNLINIIILLIIILQINSTDKVCRNPNGVEVDWYIIFFMPKSASSDKQIHYAYFDDTLNTLQYYLYEEPSFPPTKITSYVTSTGGLDFNYFFWNDDLTVKDGESKSASSTRALQKVL